MKVVWCQLQVIVVWKEVVSEQQWKKFHPLSSSQAISEAIWSVLKHSADMDAGQAANHTHTTEWMKAMCRHMYNKVSEASPQHYGLEMTVCGLLNHAVLEEVHGSAAGNDLRGAEAAECAELCAHCEAGDKHPGCGLLTGKGPEWKQSWLCGQRALSDIISLKHCRAHFCMSCNCSICISSELRISYQRDILFCREHAQRRYTQTPLHTVVNPAALECPQRVVLISIFIEMLSKPLRATRSNQCCLGSVLQRQVSPLSLPLFVFMPFTLIPLKRRWSHTSVIPAPKERISSDRTLADYNAL